MRCEPIARSEALPALTRGCERPPRDRDEPGSHQADPAHWAILLVASDPDRPASLTRPSARGREQRYVEAAAAGNEDLLTERRTLAVPRLCHNAQADPLRKQQVLGSNPSVGSTPPFRAPEDLLSVQVGAPRHRCQACHNACRPGRPANWTGSSSPRVRVPIRRDRGRSVNGRSMTCCLPRSRPRDPPHHCSAYVLLNCPQNSPLIARRYPPGS